MSTILWLGKEQKACLEGDSYSEEKGKNCYKTIGLAEATVPKRSSWAPRRHYPPRGSEGGP